MTTWRCGINMDRYMEIAADVREIVIDHGSVAINNEGTVWDFDTVACVILDKYSDHAELVAAGACIEMAVRGIEEELRKEIK